MTGPDRRSQTDAEDPAELPVAYCAPGCKDSAAFILARHGEPFSELVETQFLTGRDVILASRHFDTGLELEFPEFTGPVKMIFSWSSAPPPRMIIGGI